jgi:hypothetical protein
VEFKFCLTKGLTKWTSKPHSSVVDLKFFLTKGLTNVTIKPHSSVLEFKFFLKKPFKIFHHASTSIVS